MFEAIHGIAPTYPSDRIVVNFDVNGYDTRWSDMDLHLPTLHNETYRNSFMYMGGKLWNELPEFVQNSSNIESFKRNCRMYKLVINSWPNRYTYIFFAICQFLHDNDVMIISRLRTNSTLYMDMDFCILLGTEFISHSMLYLCH